jgi:hypothetical protein
VNETYQFGSFGEEAVYALMTVYNRRTVLGGGIASLAPAQISVAWCEDPEPARREIVETEQHVQRVMKLPQGECFAAEFFSRPLAEHEETLAPELKPSSFENFTDWSVAVRKAYYAERIYEITIADLTTKPPGEEICVCGDPSCQIGPMTIR